MVLKSQERLVSFLKQKNSSSNSTPGLSLGIPAMQTSFLLSTSAFLLALLPSHQRNDNHHPLVASSPNSTHESQKPKENTLICLKMSLANSNFHRKNVLTLSVLVRRVFSFQTCSSPNDYSVCWHFCESMFKPSLRVRKSPWICRQLPVGSHFAECVLGVRRWARCLKTGSSCECATLFLEAEVSPWDGCRGFLPFHLGALLQGL